MKNSASAIQRSRLHCMSNTESHDKEWLLRVESIVRQNISNPQLSVEYIVRKSFSSRNGFFSRFKSLLGITPNQYIRKIRLEAAKELLETQQYSTLNEVAAHVGFARADYFSKLFQDEYHQNPIQYLYNK